jgi:fumarate reductase flavoprotein subunit
MRDKAADKGANFKFSTTAKQLSEEKRSRNRSNCSRCDGNYIKCNARKGVFLCTGDYSNNKKMISAYCPNALFAANRPLKVNLMAQDSKWACG